MGGAYERYAIIVAPAVFVTEPALSAAVACLATVFAGLCAHLAHSHIKCALSVDDAAEELPIKPSRR